MSTDSKKLRQRRKSLVRKQRSRTERHLLTIFRSAKHTYAQIVDPFSGKTLTSTSTRSPSVREGLKSTGDKAAAARVGERIAELAKGQGIDSVSFNRNGFVFAGRVKALADAAREAGLKF